MSDDKQEENTEERRIVAIMIKPCDGVDPEGLYKKITETIKGSEEAKVKWDEKCKVDGGKIYASFTIEISGTW